MFGVRGLNLAFFVCMEASLLSIFMILLIRLSIFESISLHIAVLAILFSSVQVDMQNLSLESNSRKSCGTGTRDSTTAIE